MPVPRRLTIGPVRFCAAVLLSAVLTPVTGSSADPAPGQPADSRAGLHQRTDRYGDPLPDGAVARIGSLRLFQGQLAALAYAPDGKTLVARDLGGTIRLWDTATGREVRSLHRHGGYGWNASIAVSPDGRRLAVAGRDEPVSVWPLDARAGARVRRLPGTERGSETVAFSPDGKLLAAATQDHNLLVWEVRGWREVCRFAGYGTSFGVALVFLPDGKTLLSGDMDGSVRLWDIPGHRPLRVVADHVKNLDGLVLTPDGKRLALSEGRSLLRLLNLADGSEVWRHTGPHDTFYHLALSRDGRTLAGSNLLKGEVHFWDMATGKPLRHWGVDLSVSLLAFAPDGKTLAVGELFTIGFRDPLTGRPTFQPPGLSRAVTSLALADGGRAVVTGCDGGAVGSWDPDTGAPLTPLRPPPDGFSTPPRYLTAPTLGVGGRLAAQAARDETLWVWEPATGKVLHRFDPGPQDPGRRGARPHGAALAGGDGQAGRAARAAARAL